MTVQEKTARKPFHQQVAEKLIEQIKAGTAPWQKPWTPGVDSTPVNPTSGKSYRGVNNLWLRMAGYNDPRWMTFKQASEAGYKIRKGEKGMPVQYWIFQERQDKLDGNGKPIIGQDGKPEKFTVELERPKVMQYTVFNAQQIDGVPELEKKELSWNPVERAENIVKSLNFAHVANDTADRAYYHPLLDEIHMPARESFPTAEAYYDVLLHEAAHGTGHESRLNRDQSGPFGGENYAREELRAEIASMLITSEIGIPHDASNNAAYVNSWVKHLENHPTEILRAAKDADKILSYVIDRERALEHEHRKEHIQATPKKEQASTVEHENAAHKAQQERTERHYIDVPAAQKDEAKELGARWEFASRSWYIPSGVNKEPFAKWESGQEKNSFREYLDVPYEEKDAAKKAGARWDKLARGWYVETSDTTALARLEQWRTQDGNPSRTSGEPALTPADELAAVLQHMGAHRESMVGHPVMDGKPHRLREANDKKGEKSIYYKAFSDGRPAGYIKNHRSGQEMNWKAKGIVLTDDQKFEMQLEAAQKLKERGIAEEKMREQAVSALAGVLNQQVGKTLKPTPYTLAKGIECNHQGTFRALKNANTLLVPAYDVNGTLQTAQYIQEDGKKRFAKGTSKEGAFHVIGQQKPDVLKDAPAIVISEGYATAATVTESVGFPTVAAFDAGNLASVAQALHERFPDKPIIIAGDDDTHLKKNPGRTKAEAVAKAVDGVAVFPTFSSRDVESAAPLSDFNDLAQSHPEGKDAVKRQISQAIQITMSKAVEQHNQTLMSHGRKEIATTRS